MRDFKLPSKLHRHFSNLSSTVQVLIGEIVLSVEGLYAEATRKAATELENSLRNQRATELLNDQLRGYLETRLLRADDATIATCAASGRSTTEIAAFLGLEYRYVMRRLCAVRKLAAAEKAPAASEVTGDGSVLELFAEAQRR